MAKDEQLAGDEQLDLVCFGRCDVDLYGEQLGSPLSSMASYAAYVGGSAANICVGSRRLGLRTAMLTRVGDEELGRFVLATFRREGVVTDFVQLDAVRPTGVVTLAVRGRDGFPRVFLYADSPDLAVDEQHVDVARVAGARALLLTGTMLSRPALAALSARLARAVLEAGGRVALDADFRPVLWGLAPIGQGNAMSAQSLEVTLAYAGVLSMCDLVVGTEEEIRAVGGTADLAEAVATIQAAHQATVVVKSGAYGATGYPPEAAGDGVRVPGFSVEILNTVGAGDGFMSGFLSRWVRAESLERCLEAGNAGGALVATRHGCMTAMPVAAELESFVRRGGVARPDEDDELQRLRRAGLRRESPARLFVLAIDHRWQLEELADSIGAPRERLKALKALLAESFLAVAADRDDCGILIDERYGAGVLEQMAGSGRFTARSADAAGSRPVQLVFGEEVQAGLHRWPADQVVKVMCYAGPDDPGELASLQEATLARLQRACLAEERELLVELQAPSGSAYGPHDLPALLRWLYRAGVTPEWWKLPAIPEAPLWEAVAAEIEQHDPSCRGVLVLGSTASRAELEASFAVLARAPRVKGFAIGRAIFAGPARSWLAGESADTDLVAAVAGAYRDAIEAWLAAGAGSGAQ